MAVIEFQNVSFAIGQKSILEDLSFSVEPGETLILLGRSGSGKTTCLKLINSLYSPTAGTVNVQGKRTQDWDLIALRRCFGYVLQEGGLFPHLSILHNIGLPLELAGWDRQDSKSRVRQLLEKMGLEPGAFEDRYPHQLSGGQRQRVSVARALAADPPFLLLDEPFGALDPITRSELQIEFQRLQQELKKTIIFVTHDVAEAFLLGTRIAYFSDGRLLSMSRPEKFRLSNEPEIAAFLEPLRQAIRTLSQKI